jgi:hypothetical protein
MPGTDTAAFCLREPAQPTAREMNESPGATRQPEEPRPPGGPRWLGPALAGCGIAMLPWLVILATSLPASTRAWHWSAAWVGLDGLEALGLMITGWLLRRADRRRCLAATATAVLLTVDAWFDVTTAAPGHDLATAIVMAACGELPMAALCAVLAARTLPRPAQLPAPQRRSPGSSPVSPPEGS